MNLALLIYGSLDSLSGGYLYDRRLVDYLRIQGDQVEIISLPWRNYAFHLADNISSRLHRRLQQLQVDVLLQDELNHPSLFWANRKLRRNVDYPVVSIIHHLRSCERRPAWRNAFYRWIEGRYLSTVDGFIYNSQTTRREVENLCPGQKTKPRPWVAAYPGRDSTNPQMQPEEIERRARQAGPLRLLFVGNLIPRKGLHLLLSALEQISPSDFKLDIAGSLEVDRAYARRLQAYVIREGLADRVHFLGMAREAELVERMRNAHIMAVPSSYEGFGIVYLEGMGYGLPAIAGDRGAAREVVTPGETGYLVEPGDTAGLASHLMQLHLDRERLVTMSLAARQRYEAHPTWEQTTGQIRNFLQSL